MTSVPPVCGVSVLAVVVVAGLDVVAVVVVAGDVEVDFVLQLEISINKTTHSPVAR
jgi:hypothetical protein